MVAEAVVRVEVLVGDGGAGVFDSGDEGFVGVAEAIVGGEDQNGAFWVDSRDLRGEGFESPVGGVGLGFVGERGA